MKRTQLINAAPGSIALAFISFASIAVGFSQTPTTIAPSPISQFTGFATTASWTVKSSSPLTAVSSTAIRTQGSAAFALVNPANPTSLVSSAVSSTAPILAGIGDAGAVFAIDLMPPTGATGSLTMSLSCPSRGLTVEQVGEVQLQGLRSGIYNTITFPIPDAVRTALGGATFNDLKFAFVLASPPPSGSTTPPQFLFDNLRVSSVPLVTGKVGVTAPSSFGGSVDLVATGPAAVTQSFAIGPVQVPDAFRLVEGTAGATTVKLALGYDGTSAFTCTYDADPSDKAGLSYLVNSCTGGVKAGDVVAANYAQLTIVGGTPSMQIQAQLAKNPVGQQVGGGIIPPMPTYWGHSNGCAPALVAGTVVNTSAGCTSQMAEVNQIVTDYFQKVSDAQPAPNWIVTPVADAALRHGTGFPVTATAPSPDEVRAPGPNPNPNPNPGPPPSSTQTNDFPFDKEGHANQGGDFDAYWRLNGDLNTVDQPSTGNSSAHFDATFSGHVVLFGSDVDVVSVNATVDTVNGSLPSATGSANVYVFGVELPGGGSVNASTGFNYNLSDSQNFKVFDVVIWIFSVEVDATASASLNATGTLAATGFSLSVDPKVSLGTHIFGGIDLGIASGGVDATIDLLDVEAPITTQAGLAMNLSPSDCALQINFSLNSKVTVSALGGQIDLVATFGPCPFCYSDSYTLLKWSPLLSTTQTLLQIGPDTLSAIPLPTSLCTQPLNVLIGSPSPSVQVGVTYPLSAAIADIGVTQGTCSNFTWTVSPTEPITTSGGCQTAIEFTKPGAHTLTATGTVSFTDSSNRTIVETGSTTRIVTAAAQTTGTFIVGTDQFVTNTPPFNSQTLNINLNFPATSVIQFTGQVNGAAETVTTTWTATDSNGKITAIPVVSCTGCTTPGDETMTVAFTIPALGTYTVKMTANDSKGNVVGTATMTVALTDVIF